MNCGLENAVHNVVRKYFSEFGPKSIRKEYGGVQYVIELQHCEITFWRYKLDVGCAIRPLSSDPTRQYVRKQIDEVMVDNQSVCIEVDRQAHLITENYTDLLAGNISDWPVE